MSGRPWFKFYPSDWRSDPALRVCSLAARGLWMEMIGIMHEAEPRGHLLIAGRPVPPDKLAALVGVSFEEVRTLLAELEDAGVFSCKRNGVVFSRRMERDEQKARKNQENGAKGGNPSLCNSKGNEASVNREDKAQKPETRNQKLDVSCVSSDTQLGGDARADELLEERLREAAGWQWHRTGKLKIIGPIKALLDDGADLELDVLPVIRAKALSIRYPNWGYFVPAIIEARDQRRAALFSSPTVIPINAQATRSSHAANFQKSARDHTFDRIEQRLIESIEAKRRAAAGGHASDAAFDEGTG
jgi:hypothetical protein